MGAMSVVVVRGGIVLHEVPAVDVVDEAVVVIIDTVSGNLARVRPDVVGKVGVVGVNATVDHCDDNGSTGASEIPGCGCIDAMRVEESPERPCLGIIARGDLNGGVECNLTDCRMRFERFLGFDEVGSCLEKVDVALAEASDKRCVGTLEEVVDIGRVGIGLELDEECVRVVLDISAVFEHDVRKLIGVAPRAVDRERLVGRRLGRCHAHGWGCDNEGERERGR